MADDGDTTKQPRLSTGAKRDAFSNVGRANSVKSMKQKVNLGDRKQTKDDTATVKKRLSDERPAKQLESDDPLARKPKKKEGTDGEKKDKPKKDGDETKPKKDKPKKDKPKNGGDDKHKKEEVTSSASERRLSRTSMSEEDSSDSKEKKPKNSSSKNQVPSPILEDDEPTNNAPESPQRTSSSAKKLKKDTLDEADEDKAAKKSKRKSAALKSSAITSLATDIALADDASGKQFANAGGTSPLPPPPTEDDLSNVVPVVDIPLNVATPRPLVLEPSPNSSPRAPAALPPPPADDGEDLPPPPSPPPEDDSETPDTLPPPPEEVKTISPEAASSKGTAGPVDTASPKSSPRPEEVKAISPRPSPRPTEASPKRSPRPESPMRSPRPAEAVKSASPISSPRPTHASEEPKAPEVLLPPSEEVKAVPPKESPRPTEALPPPTEEVKAVSSTIIGTLPPAPEDPSAVELPLVDEPPPPPPAEDSEDEAPPPPESESDEEVPPPPPVVEPEPTPQIEPQFVTQIQTPTELHTAVSPRPLIVETPASPTTTPEAILPLVHSPPKGDSSPRVQVQPATPTPASPRTVGTPRRDSTGAGEAPTAAPASPRANTPRRRDSTNAEGTSPRTPGHKDSGTSSAKEEIVVTGIAQQVTTKDPNADTVVAGAEAVSIPAIATIKSSSDVLAAPEGEEPSTKKDKKSGRERSHTRDDSAGSTGAGEPRVQHLKAGLTRERSHTRDDISPVTKKGRNRPVAESDGGSDSAASSDNEDDNSSTGSNDASKKKVKKSKSRGTIRSGSISRQSGIEVKMQLAALGITGEPKPDEPSAPANPQTSATTPPAPLPEGVPAPPPPPGKGQISKEKLLEPEQVRKVLTRLATPKIDEELKKWDKKLLAYEDIFSGPLVTQDPLHREIIIFPSNDVYVETVKRDVGKLPTPDNDTPGFVKDSLDFFTGDLKHVKNGSEKYGGRTSLQGRIKEKEEREIRTKILQEKAEKAEKEGDKKKKKKGGSFISGSATPRGSVSGKKARASVSVADAPSASSTAPAPLVSKGSETSLKLPDSARKESPSTPRSPTNKKSLDISVSSGASGPSTPKTARGSRGAADENEDSSDSSSKSSASTQTPLALHEPLLSLDENIQKVMRQKREEHMTGVFETFSTTNISAEATENRTQVKPLSKNYGTRVLLQAKSLAITVGVEDAFFFTLSFYDIQKKLKLTEDFYFDFNDQNELIKALLGGQSSTNEAEAKAKHGLFNFSYTSENIYLVIRAATILKGDVDGIAEVYNPGHNLSAGHRQKWIDANRTAASMLGKFRQSFAWACAPVFDNSGNLLMTRDMKVGFYKMKSAINDDALYDILNSEEKYKRLKPMDFSVVLDSVIYQKDKHILKKVVNSSLIQIPNYEDGQHLFDKSDSKSSDSSVKKPKITTSGSDSLRVSEKASSEKESAKKKFDLVVDDVVKEVQEFDQPFHKAYLNTTFVNNLYVYPLEIAFNSQKVKVKSIICRAYLLSGECGSPDSQALQVAYARNSFENFGRHISTTVVFEEKNPSLFDEIKFQLPLSLSEKHHLLFAFFSVDTKVLKPEKRKEGPAQTESLLGFCWQPIYKDKRLLKDNEYSLPVDQPPANNMFVDYLEHIHKPIDPEKIYFRFRTRLVSSVYTHDESLAAFFNAVHHRKTDHELMQPLHYISSVNDRILIQFSPTVMNQLLASMVKAKTDAAGNKIFLALLDVAARAFNLTMNSGKVSISEPLYAYISHHFDNAKNGHEALARFWVGALKTSANVDPDVVLPPEAARTRELVFMSMKELSWFLLELVYKSMVLSVHASGALGNEDNRKTRFSTGFKQSLKDLIKLSDVYRKKNATGFDFVSKNFGLFLTDLIRIHDRGHVLDLIGDYVLAIGTDNVQSAFRYRLLQLITDFEHYIPLNIPIETPIDTIDAMQLRFWKNHWLAGLYIHDLKNSLLGMEEARPSRAKAIARFRDLLWKHYLDDRYQSKEIRSRIAGIYFPLLVVGVENVVAVQKTASEKSGDAELREWCLVMLWILQYCNRDLHLRAWWSYESEQNILQLVQLLKLCIDTFAHDETMKDETIFIITDVLDYFFDDFPEELATEGSKIYEVVAQLLLHLLRLSKAESLIRDVLKIVRSFIVKFRKPLFRYLTNYSFVSDLSYEIFNLCHSQPKKVARDATTLLYLLLRTNSDEMGHFARMKLQSTLAISRLAKLDKCNFDELQQSLDALQSYKDPKNAQASWQSQVRELVSRHLRVIRDSVRIAQINDIFLDHKAELFYKISLEYVNSPDLRITWLNNLATYHEKTESFEEAAHCKVQIALLISEYLSQVMKPKVKGLPADSSRFARISPNVANEKGLSVLWLEGSIISPDFSEDGFAKALMDAINLFIKVENYECAIESYMLLNRFYNDNRKYQNLSTSSQAVASLSDKVYAANRAQSRIPPNFYRVGFYGEGFGDDNGKEFIYREPPALRLADFTSNLVKRYEDQFGAANFELLKNIKPLEEMQLDPKKNYLQIVAVEIFYEFDELNARDLTYTDRSFNCKRFVFENPYSPDGSKPTEDPAKSWKRKNILTTRAAIPHMLKRVEVAKKESKILSPIESAVDVIQSIVVRLKQCLNCTPPNIKTLQIILQGAILTQVNAGPLAILKVFLGNQTAYPANLIEMLKDQFRAFLRSSQFGIRLNQSLIASQPEFAPLQEALTSSFASLRTEAAKYIEF